MSDQDRNAAIFSYILDHGKHQALFPLSSHGDFYKFIPSRLGMNPALDMSISCLCTIYTDTLSTSSPTSKDSIRSYARALSTLRACLETERVRTESETICASIILQLCEVRLQSEFCLHTLSLHWVPFWWSYSSWRMRTMGVGINSRKDQSFLYRSVDQLVLHLRLSALCLSLSEPSL